MLFSEPNDESTILNGIKSLSDDITGNNKTIDNFMFQNEEISNENSNNYQNPFIPDDKVDLNKVLDLSEYLNDAQAFNTDPNVSIMETSKNNELNSTSGECILKNELVAKLNDNLSIDEHIKYEQDMNSKNINDTTTIDLTSHLVESFEHNDDFKNEFSNISHIDKFNQFEDHKLNDSVSTTDAVLGSELNTPMRIDNQSASESENEDDQFSDSFKQQMHFNQLDEHNKKTEEPFCFEQVEDPAGIIPNVIHEINKEINEKHHNDGNTKSDNSSNEPKLIKHEPVEEPLCIKEEAKPFHSVYEQQYLPESDFSESTHEALLNTIESNCENNVNIEHFEQHNIIENVIENKEKNIESQNAYEHLKQEPTAPNHGDEIEQNDNTHDFEQENNCVINSKHVKNEHIKENEKEYVDDFECHYEANKTVILTEDFEQEHKDISKVVQDNGVDLFQNHNDIDPYENQIIDFQPKCHDAGDISNNILNFKQEDQFYVSDLNESKNISEITQSHTEEFEQKYNKVSPQMQTDCVKIETNDVNVIQQEHLDTVIVNNNPIEDFKHEYTDVAKEENICAEDFKQQTHDDGTENVVNFNEDFQQEQHGLESYQNHTADSDEEMHSSMIIHSDVENNIPQPYCSAHVPLMNEPDMMCTSMTFEENFQNRNMSDSLYVMETSSDYFGDIQQTMQLDQSIDEPKVETKLSNIINEEFIEPVQTENKFITEEKSELVSESKIEEGKAEVTELSQLMKQNVDEKMNKLEESNKVCFLINPLQFTNYILILSNINNLLNYRLLKLQLLQLLVLLLLQL